MKSIFFEEKTRVHSSETLEKLTGLPKFFFDKNASVTFEGKVSIAAGIHFRGECIIGDGVSIDTGCVLTNVTIGGWSNVRSHSVLENSIFGKENTIGPFCFVRNKTLVSDNCIIGSHVEVARSILNSNVKISHQAFIGDVTIEKDVIIGAGVVFCNYDGESKKSSSVGQGSILGSGSMIVSPVKIGSKVVIGAGSIVTKDLKDETRFIQKRYF